MTSANTLAKVERRKRISLIRVPIDMMRGVKQPGDLTGQRILILAVPHAGSEGVCVGKSTDGKRWAISPDGSDEILHLLYEKEFGLLVDLSSDPGRN